VPRHVSINELGAATKRVFGIKIPTAGSTVADRFKIIASIEEPAVIGRILEQPAA
jgi:hypothetical protein